MTVDAPRRVMALDVGDSRIGVAVSDPLAILARPLLTLGRSDDGSTVSQIRQLVDEWQVALVIVGHPLLPSGDRGEQALKTERFARDLAPHVAVAVELWDESLSTVEAEQRRAERPARRRAADPGLDAEAAAVILEEYLRARPSGETPPVVAPQQREGGVSSDAAQE